MHPKKVYTTYGYKFASEWECHKKEHIGTIELHEYGTLLPKSTTQIVILNPRRLWLTRSEDCQIELPKCRI